MELKVYFRMIVKNWWMILLTMFVCVNVTMFVSFTSPTIYRTTAKYVVSPSLNMFTGQDLIDSMKALENRTIVNTYNAMVNSDSLYTATLNDLGISPDDPDLDNLRRGSVILTNTNFIEITVEGENPQLIADIANTMGEEGAVMVNEMYSNTFDMTAFDAAKVPTNPISPNPVQDIAVAFALSFVVGVCLAFLVEQIKMPLSEIRKRNQIDKMANCYNTKYFIYLLEQNSLEEDNKPISIGVIEFTGLTALLENLPTTIQQSMLTRLTHLLRNEVRGNDVIGRLGPATFGIMMCTTPDFASHKTIERILNHMSISLPLEEENIPVAPIGNASELLEGEPVTICLERVKNSLGKAEQLHSGDKDSGPK